MATKVCLEFLLLLVFLTFCEGGFVNITIEGWNVPVCESSSLCNPQNGCISVNHGSDVTCRCDPPCFFFNDCCPDYLTSCANATLPSHFLDATENLASDQLSCTVPPHSYSSGNDTAFLMIDECLSDWSNELTREHCERSANESDFFTLAPVSLGSSISFKNAYCAICNRENILEVMPWSFQLECGSQIPNISTNATFQERINILMENCTNWFFIPPPSGLTDVRTCPKFGRNKTCQNTHDEEESEAIRRACHSYLASFVSLQDGRMYRNPHCFLCGHMSAQYNISVLHSLLAYVMPCTDLQQAQPTRQSGTSGTTQEQDETHGNIQRNISTLLLLSVSTSYHNVPTTTFDHTSYITDILMTSIYLKGEGPQPLQPISVLIDFTSLDDAPFLEEVVSVDCNHTQVFNPSVQRCIELSCPAGYKLLNRSCVDSTQINMRCSNNSQIPSTAKMSCEHEARGVSFCAPLWSIANETVSWFTGNSNHLQNIYVQEITAAWMNVSSGNSEIGTCLQVVLISFDSSRDFTPFRLPSENVLWAASGIKNSKNLTCRISEVDVSVGCVRREDRSCRNNSIRFSEFKIKGDSSRMTFFVSETNTSYAIEDSLYTQRFRWSTDNSSNLDADLLVCRRREYSSQCALITLNISDFVILSNGSLLYEPLNVVFDPDDYALVNNDSIQVCSFLDGSGNLTREYYFIPFSKGQSITSFVGCLLSIAGLLFTFVTYAKFGSLRKSICSQLVMSICASLTLAQLTLLFSSLAKSNPISCTCFAVLGHYLWLVVFTHSVALALDLYRRFGLTQKVKKTSEGPKLLSMFLVFAWGSPLLIVIPCLVVHLCKLPHVALTYGTVKSCWIGNGFMNLYAFGVPVALTLVVNGTLFVLVVAGLRKSTNQTTKRKASKMATEGVVYLKMSTLLGFTWTFGFIAAFVHVTALWYIFIILNSLQGVYIFIAFICNKRVFKLWRDSCSCKPCVSLTISCPCLRSSSDEPPSSTKTASSTWTSSSVSSTKKEASSTSISMTEASSSYSVPEMTQNQIETDSSALKGPIPVFPSSSPSSSPLARTDGPVNVPVSSQLMSELKTKFDRKV